MPQKDPMCYYPITLQAIDSELRRLNSSLGWTETELDDSDPKTYIGQIAHLFTLVHTMHKTRRDGDDPLAGALDASVKIGWMLHAVEQLARIHPMLAWDSNRSNSLLNADRAEGFDRPIMPGTRTLHLGRISLRWDPS